jgi:hypothetical protein
MLPGSYSKISPESKLLPSPFIRGHMFRTDAAALGVYMEIGSHGTRELLGKPVHNGRPLRLTQAIVIGPGGEVMHSEGLYVPVALITAIEILKLFVVGHGFS